MTESKLKVMTIVGTRPEIIRLAAVVKLLDRHVNHKMIHTAGPTIIWGWTPPAWGMSWARP